MMPIENNYFTNVLFIYIVYSSQPARSIKMSTKSKQLLNAVATAAFAIAATATTVSSAFAQSAAPAAKPAPTAAPATVAAAALPATVSAQPAQLTREQVQAAYLEARKNGTLIETEVDLDVAQTRKHFAK